MADSFESGVALFNAGRYWRSHEAWETIWIPARGEERRFLQGLILIAAACHHQVKGDNVKGRDSCRRRAGERLAGLPCPYRGVDWRALLTTTDAFFSGAPSPRIT